jgi:hypothetical protein
MIKVPNLLPASAATVLTGLLRTRFAVVVGCVIFTACASESESQTTRPTTVASIAESSASVDTDPPNWRSEWVSVKYRDTPVDVGSPAFVELGRSGDGTVRTAWYDASADYMVINLSGVNYHYCGLPTTAWGRLVSASSLDEQYEAYIKGSYDCRSIGFVPDYGSISPGVSG